MRRVESRETPLDLLLMGVVFALMGAFFWAIRGTGGYGGAQGGALAGLGWAMLWHAFSRRGGVERERPYGTGHAIAAITLGITLGGMTGYGVYNGWVQGKFYLAYPDGLRAVAPWTGYAMLFLCGLHWGGITGAFLAWCAPLRPVTQRTWPARILAGVAGALLASVIVRVFPQLFLPFYGEGIYGDSANETCRRAMGSIQNIAPHVGAYLGFLGAEIVRRDKRAIGVMLILGLGFAIPFSVGGIWHTFNDSGVRMPWWKFWEMSIGFGGGLAFALVFGLFNQPAGGVSRSVTRNERIGPVAVIIVLASTVVVSSAAKGFLDQHGWGEHGGARSGIAVVWLSCMVAFFVIWLRKPRHPRDEEVVPGWLPPAMVGVIVVAGFLVSMPPKLAPENRVLLALYTGYLVVSIGSFALLRRRRR